MIIESWMHDTKEIFSFIYFFCFEKAMQTLARSRMVDILWVLKMSFSIQAVVYDRWNQKEPNITCFE